MDLSIILPIMAAAWSRRLDWSLITNWMTVRRETTARGIAFRKQQLEQFYGPLLAMHKEILARSELRVKLERAVDQMHLSSMVHAGPHRIAEASDANMPIILRTSTTQNKTLRDVLMPRYQERY